METTISALKNFNSTQKTRMGKSDGLGYLVLDITPGAGFSSKEFAVKKMPNGVNVQRETYYPGPFELMAGLGGEIRETYMVCVGWEPFDETLSEIDPMDLPKGALKWFNPDICDDSLWFAQFNDGDDAENFAMSLEERLFIPALKRVLFSPKAKEIQS
jgi:hypothetical protein